MTTLNIHHPMYLLAFILSLPYVLAQVGTITQDLTTLAAFPLQKACAQSCFVRNGFCPDDVLGSAIGCASRTDCNDRGYQAKNDCYCRQDLMEPAMVFLSSCVSKKCTVGDVAIDAASAGSVYGAYCAGKGYTPPAKPAQVPATTTGGLGAAKGTGSRLSSLPTSTATTQNTSGPTTALPISTIIGIVVGGIAGIILLGFLIKMIFSGVERWNNRKQRQLQQQPMPYAQVVYPPTHPSEQPWYPRPAESEVGPSDSVSVRNGMPGPVPTIVSTTPAPNQAPYFPRGY